MAKNNLNAQKGDKSRLEFRQAVAITLITAVTSIIAAAIPAYFAGKQQSKGSAANSPVESNRNPSYQDEIKSLERTVDVLMGKVDRYEEQLTVPQSRITLYEHIGYKGHGCYVRLADNASDLRSYGCGNTVSSIRVEGNIKGKAYSAINYSSSPLDIDHDMPFLDINWNDRILSIIVEQKEQN